MVRRITLSGNPCCPFVDLDGPSGVARAGRLQWARLNWQSRVLGALLRFVGCMMMMRRRTRRRSLSPVVIESVRLHETEMVPPRQDLLRV